jgi:pimeloyl-ACP methyl ester carboxylesterase
MLSLRPWLGACALLLGVQLARAQAPQVVDIPTRPGVTQRMLVLQPAEVSSALVLLPGGLGRVGISDSGTLRNAGNFLVRSRELFAQHGHAVLLLDTPGDRAEGLGGDFRESAEHAADLGAAVAWARARFGKPVGLVGTSRGTHSAAHAALTLAGPAAPDGIVLSSTILVRGRSGGPTTARPVIDMDLARLKVPVLVVHHAQDACPVCPPQRLAELMAKLPGGRSELLTYSGGQSEGPACEAFSHHGYNGIEAEVVAGISGWVGR